MSKKASGKTFQGPPKFQLITTSYSVTIISVAFGTAA